MKFFQELHDLCTFALNAANFSTFLINRYGVRGPREKRIILNILPVSKRHELKFSLKIEFSFLAIIVKWQVPN